MSDTRFDTIGTVRAIHRYPVKSLGGETLATATLRWPGLDGDRQYAFYRAANRSRFPWLTGREVAELVTWAARYVEPENPRKSPVRIRAGDSEHDIGDPVLRERLSRAAGEEVRLLQVGRGTFDSMPVSVLSTATLAQVAARHARPVDLRRFRANIVIEPAGGADVRETAWLGGTLIFGDGASAPRLRLTAPIDRCSMITLDPDGAARDPALLRRVVGDFHNRIGVYATIAAIGTIAVGDRVRWAPSA